jgi:uncharacterized protein YdhG (YjbR/CyaY superfamily)
MRLIDDYLTKIEPSKRKELQRILRLAKEIVPSAEETISYKMPFCKNNLRQGHDGQPLS